MPSTKGEQAAPAYTGRLVPFIGGKHLPFHSPAPSLGFNHDHEGRKPLTEVGINVRKYLGSTRKYMKVESLLYKKVASGLPPHAYSGTD